MDAALLLTALASRAGDRVDFLAGDRWIRARVRRPARRTRPPCSGTSCRRWRRWSRLCSRPTGPPGQRDAPTRAGSRSLVVLLTPLEPVRDRRVAAAGLPTLTHHHRVVLASVSRPRPRRMARRARASDEVYDAAAAERTLALRERTGAMLGPLGVDVIDAPPDQLPPRSPTTTCC